MATYRGQNEQSMGFAAVLAHAERKTWDSYGASNVPSGSRPISYAQAIGVLNALCHRQDRMAAAA
ncbi:MAG: thiamine pyrophosphate protein central region, partial [uncultured bacterium]